MIDKVYMLTILTICTIITTEVAIRTWINLARKGGIKGRDVHKHGEIYIPEMGGIPLVVSFVIISLTLVGLNTFYYKLHEENILIFAILVGVLISTLVGVMDDILGWKLGLRQWHKPFLTAFAAIPLMVINAGTHYIHIFGMKLALGHMYVLIFIPLFIIFTTNSFNMLAGYNGLEGGMGIIILVVLAYINYSNWVIYLIIVIIGGLLVFLRYNFYPSKIFPGDVLTYSVGFFIASIIIITNCERIGIVLLTPYICEFFLKARGRFSKESFSKVNEKGKLEYNEKIYSLPHLIIKLFEKLQLEITEKKVVLTIYLIEVIIALVILIMRWRN